MKNGIRMYIGALALATCSIGTAWGTTITFNEYPFPVANTTFSDTTGTATSSTLYNLIDDTLLTLLAANNGDLNDLTITTTEQTPPGTQGRSLTQWQTTSDGRFTSTRSFTGAPASNNPGSLVSSTITVRFGSHLTISNVMASFLSLNTAGSAWEYSVLGFLRPDGTFFSPQPLIGSYSTATGLTGSPSAGWYVASSKDTVGGVGGTTTTAGTNGASDNFTFTLASAGLSADTLVGGLVMMTFLEDVRGTGNTGSTSLTASLTQLSFDVAVPEPGTFGLLGVGLLLAIVRFR